jgi:putative ABC transport system permease protein
VLLIACANLTTLLLARGAVKSPEMALRRAIGASRWELARPQMIESLILGALGGAVGLASAMWAGPLVVSAQR